MDLCDLRLRGASTPPAPAGSHRVCVDAVRRQHVPRWFHNCCIRGPAPSGDGDDEWFCEDCVAAAPDEEDTDTLEPEA